MSAQLALPLAWPADPSDDEFVVTPSNEQAVRLLADPAAWPVSAALLVGPRKSGRSLLARIFAARTGGQVIDDAQGLAEAELFHAWNRAQASGQPGPRQPRPRQQPRPRRTAKAKAAPPKV